MGVKRKEKALREQTAGEEIANTVTHVIGSHLGAAMLALLVWAGVNSGVDVARKVTCASIFGASVILLYAISSAYHAVQHPPAKRVLKVLDHMAIFCGIRCHGMGGRGGCCSALHCGCRVAGYACRGGCMDIRSPATIRNVIGRTMAVSRMRRTNGMASADPVRNTPITPA